MQGTYKADPERIKRCVFVFVCVRFRQCLCLCLCARACIFVCARLRRSAMCACTLISFIADVFHLACRFMSLGLDVFREEDDQLEMKVIVVGSCFLLLLLLVLLW